MFKIQSCICVECVSLVICLLSAGQPDQLRRGCIRELVQQRLNRLTGWSLVSKSIHRLQKRPMATVTWRKPAGLSCNLNADHTVLDFHFPALELLEISNVQRQETRRRGCFSTLPSFNDSQMLHIVFYIHIYLFSIASWSLFSHSFESVYIKLHQNKFLVSF